MDTKQKPDKGTKGNGETPFAKRIEIASAFEKRGKPFIFLIKNNTFEYIKEFKLCEGDNRVSITNGYTQGMSAEQAILSLRVSQPEICIVRYQVVHDYPKYASLQLSKQIIFVKKESDGAVFESPIGNHVNLNQFVGGVTESKVDLKLTDGFDFKFDMMPEAYVMLYLYPKVVTEERTV